MSDVENSLGEGLRAWRDRLSTADVGLPATRRRRTAGLRREELASLAGISVDYLLRLEQGRARRPSRQVLDALARAMRLSADETCHLHLIAGFLPPSPGQVSGHVPPSVQRLVRRFGEVPVGVFAADWTLLTSPRERNLVRELFIRSPDSKRPPIFPIERDSTGFKTALVADLRLTRSAYPDDEELARLVRESARVSAEFRELWAMPTLGSRMGGTERFQHPLVGEINLDCDVLKVPGDDVRIVTYTAAAGTSDAEKLDFLRVAAARAVLPATDATSGTSSTSEESF
jgi:transcriptional regulator with XRE-family HTH domain